MWNVFSEPFMNAAKIFPTQQKDVHTIIERCKQDNNILRLIVFGSSITSACNPWSDIDIYADMIEDKNFPSLGVYEVPVDKWTNFTVDEDLYREIKQGVTVYVRDAVGQSKV